MATGSDLSARYETVRGHTCYLRDDHTPDPASGVVWFRHDRAFYNGQRLEGSIMSRLRVANGREIRERHTYFRNEFVRGVDLVWLVRCNAEVASVEDAQEHLVGAG